jgi:uncharacterized protein (DUF983 family)
MGVLDRAKDHAPRRNPHGAGAAAVVADRAGLCHGHLRQTFRPQTRWCDMSETRSGQSVWRAMWNGLRCRCPRCGQGWLFHRYLEQNANCSNCGEPLARYNVGLFLPLVVITVVIHVVAFAMLEIELNGWGNPQVYLYTLMPLSIIVPLLILPSSKGAIIGLFWFNGWSDEADK